MEIRYNNSATFSLLCRSCYFLLFQLSVLIFFNHAEASTKIAAGAGHTIAIKSDGTLWAWGGNSSGALGDGTTTTKGDPGKIGAGTNWRTAAGGGGYTVAIKSDGTLWAWGYNGSGQLGDGTTVDKSVPTQIGLDKNWVTVTTGQTHAVAIKSDGTLWAWGWNALGQVGDGTLTQRTSPVQIGTDTKWVAVSAGHYHTLALKSDGTLWAWGTNDYGRLGDGTTTQRTAPVQVGTDTRWTAVSGGYDHSLAVKSDGTLWAWGRNYYGALGDGTTTQKTSPIQVGTDSNWVLPAAGGYFSVALKSDGTLWSWGYNAHGQLGDGTTTQKYIPTQIGTETKWASATTFATDLGFVVAAKSDGSLWAWGYNSSGQLGDGTSTNRHTPLKLMWLDINWSAVTAGGHNTAALKSDGTLWTWGYNAYGQLADRSTSDKHLPQKALDSGWTRIEAGAYHTLGIKPDGSLWAWGYNGLGQLGDGSYDHKDTPTRIGTDTKWVAVSAGTYHSAGIKSNGTLWAWGYNYYGQLGDGTTSTKTTPTQIGSDTTWVSVSAGQYHTVAIKADGTIWTWGYNADGQLGNRSLINMSTPTQVIDVITENFESGMSSLPWSVNEDYPWDITAATAHSGSYAAGAPVLSDSQSAAVEFSRNCPTGTISFWYAVSSEANYDYLRFYIDGVQQNAWSGTAPWTQVSYQISAGMHTFMWEYSKDGSVSTGSDTAWIDDIAISPSNPNSWVSATAGGSHTLAVKSDGTLWAWGYNGYGQLGDGSTAQQTSPVHVGTDTTWVTASAGLYHTAAVKSDGTLWAWGYNGYGQLGDGSTTQQTSPVKVGTDTTWSSVAAGYHHTVALKANGTVWTWGYNYFGQLGDWTTGNKSAPVWVSPVYEWASISAGTSHVSAVKSDGTLWTWGLNDYGQLGDGTTINRGAPVHVGTDMYLSVANGSRHTTAVRHNGTSWSWGYNYYGQLGDGTTFDRHTPVQMGEDAWAAIEAGFNHTIAIRTDGTLWGWGSNSRGQLGDGTVTQRNVPTSIGTDTWTSSAAGHDFTVGVKSNGTLWAWGYNYYGQLGNNTSDSSSHMNPVQVGTDNTWLAVAAGEYFVIALKSNGTLWGWGRNYYGQLGNSTTSDQHAPVQIGIDSDWVAATAGSEHTVAVKSNGTIWGWGRNWYGQLGDGTGADRNVPVQIGTDTGWVSASAGYYFTVATKSDGTLWSWGRNDVGQLGNGTTSNRYSPARVVFPLSVTMSGYGSGTVGTSGMTCNGTTCSGSYEYGTTLVLTATPDGNSGFSNWFNCPNPSGNSCTITIAWDLAPITAVFNDTSLPTGSVSISPDFTSGPTKYTMGTTLNLSLLANDPVGVLQMRFSEDGSTWSSAETFSLYKQYALMNTTDGVHMVWVQYKDLAGNWSTAQIKDSITLKRSGPVGTNITIAADVVSGPTKYVRSSPVNLTLAATDVTGVAQMQFSSDGTNWLSPESFGGSKSWPLSAGDGAKNVYVRFRDNVGNWSNSVSDSVVFDSQAPSGSLSIAGSPTFIANAAVTLTIACSDTTSGCNKMQFSTNGTLWSPLSPLLTSTTWDLDNAAFGGSSTDGLKSVYTRFQDTAGNISSTTISTTITLDRTPPGGSITINNGAVNTINSSVILTLSCTDATSGCDTMEFRNDSGSWSNPPEPFNSSRVWLLSPENGTRTVSVRLTDKAGLTSTYSSSIYLDDTSPTTSVSSPVSTLNLSSATDVYLSCDDVSGIGCAATYYTVDGSPPTEASPQYTGTPIRFSGFTSPVQLKFFSVDSLGNKESPKTVTVSFVAGFTTLTLDTPPTLLQSGLLDVSGKLTRYPDSIEVPNNGMNLSGLPVTLTVTGPTGSPCAAGCTVSETFDAQGLPHQIVTYSPFGHYKVERINAFNFPGVYTLTAHFTGTGLHQAADSPAESLLVGASAGYAVIVEGRISTDEGLTSHNKTTNRVYQTLKDRGFEDDNIMYFNYGFGIVPGVDAVPVKGTGSDDPNTIRWAVETWAKEHINGAPAPLYIIFVDHGNNNTFYIHPETITPVELNSWLSNLEANLTPAGKLQKRIIVLGACYSGSFLDELKQARDPGAPGPEPPQRDPNAGRIVISSAAADEQSYKGPNEPDGIRSGEFFIEELFKSLKKGSSLKTAFVDAATQTRAFTSQGSGSSNATNGYNDTAVQHPLLEDDGDGIGSNSLVDNMGDGVESASIHLGIGLTNASLGPADIKAVTGTLFLDKDTTQANLWAEAYSNAAVSSAWFEVKAPTTTLAGVPGQTGQLDLDLPRWTMTLTGDRWQSVYGSNSGKPNEKFGSAGKYEVFYFTKSKNAEISEMRRSVVYKNYYNNPVPTAFDLVAPANASQVRTEFNMVWQPSHDTDGLTYTVQIATDGSSEAAFTSSLVFQKEEIETTWYSVDASVGLNDAVTYYWRVVAVDRFGASTTSTQQWMFATNNTNAIPGQIRGYVSDALGSPVAGATISALSGTSVVAQTSSGAGGAFVFVVSPGGYTLNAVATGYTPGSSNLITLASGGVQNVNLTVTIANPALQIMLTGNGSGTVSSDSGGISCLNGSPDNCSAPYSNGTLVTLTATPDWKSLFGGWSGCSTIEALTGNCQVSMNANKSVACNFTPNLQARVGATGYASLQEAYDNLATLDGSIIMAREYTFLEPGLLFNSSKTVTIDGGWDSGYSLQTGMTTIDGTLTVRNGRLNVRGLIVR